MCNSTTAAKTPLLHSLPQTSETLRNLGPRPEMRKKARPPSALGETLTAFASRTPETVTAHQWHRQQAGANPDTVTTPP